MEADKIRQYSIRNVHILMQLCTNHTAGVKMPRFGSLLDDLALVWNTECIRLCELNELLFPYKLQQKSISELFQKSKA